MNIEFGGILGILQKHKVRFFITGGISAVLQGAPITTFDLDVVHERSQENVQKLKNALDEMDAYYRTRRDIKIRPQLDDLSGKGHHLLLTTFGPLDVLGTIGNGRDFSDFIDETEIVTLEKYSVNVQTLRSLIQTKEEVGMEKDSAMLPILRQTLRERKS